MKLFRKYNNFLLFSLMAIWVLWWLRTNPAPDGYQNEYLHIGNAFNLWEYAAAGDTYTLRLEAYTGYWPFGFHVLPWPFMAIFGMTRTALMLSNLVHLAVLMMGCFLLAKRFGRPMLFATLCFCPAVFGALTRFEPNLANIAWMAFGLGCLLSSGGFTNRRMSLLWGASLGIGLMMDRLTLVFFLIPPALPYLKGLTSTARRHLLYALLIALIIVGAYYREFFKYHSEELFSQVNTGEIDSAGAIDASGGPFYYILGLIDAQAGPFIGVLMLSGLFIAIYQYVRQPKQKDLVLLLACLPGILFFSFLGKKQLYYTFPALVPFAIWASGLGRYTVLGLVLGLLGWLNLGCGIGSVGGTWLPPKWTAPRHVLAKPPSNLDWPFQSLTQSIEDAGGQVFVFSESDVYFEGFVSLSMRELLPQRTIRSVVLDPHGSNEFMAQAEYFVWIRSDINAWPKKYLINCKVETDATFESRANDLSLWPTARAIQCELDADHYDIKQLPPIWNTVSSAQPEFSLVKAIPLGEKTAILFKRNAP